MKKLFTLAVGLAFSNYIFGQAQRLVLIEEFTQASCGPCASQNPAFNALLEDNLSKLVAIKYHTVWPGVDEMNEHNPSDVDDRVNYYTIIGVPQGVIDGEDIANDCGAYLGAPACLDQAEIDDEYEVTSPMTLDLSHYLSQDGDSIYVTLTINALSDVSGTLKARIAVIEKVVTFDSPPGSNGETVFPDVIKKMLPDAEGTSLPDFTAGNSYELQASWKLANIYDMNQLAVVAFIQDDVNKEVLQTTISEPQQLQNFGSITSLSSSSGITCDGNVTPSIIFTNTGTSTITSAVITVSVDGVADTTYTWTGSLASGASSASITLPALMLSTGSHSITANVSNVNGIDLNAGIINPFITPTVLGTAIETPLIEGFVSTTFPPPGWAINNPDGDATFTRTTATGGFELSTNSVKYPFYLVGEGAVDELFPQNLDLSDASQTLAYLEFSIAKAKYTGYNDRLEILASSDCGITWVTEFDKDDNGGLNTATSTSDWTPTAANQWRKEVVDLIDMIGNSNVIIKFKVTSGYGNNMYIDDINIHYGNVVAVDESDIIGGISMFPNPADASTIIQIDQTIPPNTTLECINLLGQSVFTTSVKSNSSHQINTSNWENNFYILRLISSDGNIIEQEKLVVTH
jgi:hypothetical protein